MGSDPTTASDEAASATAAHPPGTARGAAERAALIRDLARMTAGDVSLGSIFDTAVAGVAHVLGHEYCKVLELLPGGQELQLVSGVGWKPGLVGSATVGTGQDSQAGYTLRSSAPVVVTDLRTEQRFWGPPLLREHAVVSGISAVIPGRHGPWGVLGVHSVERHAYTPDDPVLVETVAAILGTAVVARHSEEEGVGSRDQAVRALRREEARSAELRAVIGAMGDGVLVFDEHDRLLLMNAAAQAILRDRPVSRLDDLAALLGLSLVGGADVPLAEHAIADGGGWVELSAFAVTGRGEGGEGPARAHDNRASTLAVVRDVTDGRRVRDARDAFVGVLSHELRTPITIIFGGAELLAREPDHDRRGEIAADVRAEADRLRRVVENLLVLSRVERNVLSLVREPVALARLVPAIVAAEQGQWDEHRLRLRTQTSVPTVAGDPTYIEQVLRNLIGNAAKFSPAGSHIEISVERDGEGARVGVHDEGPGFAANEAESLFSLFYRSPTARNVPGSGIGLFVSRQLVELMGGTISARSNGGTGATFEIALPAYRESD